MSFEPSIEAMIEQIRQQLTATATPEHLEEVNRKMDLTFEDHFAFQQVKSLAQAQGRITLEAALAAYEILGQTANSFNCRPLEQKMFVTLMMASLTKNRGANV